MPYESKRATVRNGGSLSAPSEYPARSRQEPVVPYDTVKVLLVFFFFLRHMEHVGLACIHAKRRCEFRCFFVFSGVLTLQSASEVHREEPAGYKTKNTKNTADACKQELPRSARLRLELLHPVPDAGPMIPLFFFDLLDPFTLLEIRDRSPVAPVCIRSSQLARVGTLKDLAKCGFFVSHFYSIARPDGLRLSNCSALNTIVDRVPFDGFKACIFYQGYKFVL